jgi:Na+/H+ antiporter NhaD/arsenite permease-like protein
MWVVGIGILLAMFYVVDTMNFRRAPRQVRFEQTHHEDWRFDGLPNVLFLALILVAVFIKNPPFLREALMIGAAVASYFTTRKSIHKANDFNFHPIQEVAILFVGIFATMMPALGWLEANSKMLGTPSPSLYYWACGTLSAFLDNAPTYLSFLSATGGTIDPNVISQIEGFLKSGADVAALTGPNVDEIRQAVGAVKQYFPAKMASGTVTVEDIRIAYLLGNTALNEFIVAISVAAVFFGAATYIGNGPNFMVKAIAEKNNIRMPSFFGYMFYSVLFVLPVCVLICAIFLRE